MEGGTNVASRGEAAAVSMSFHQLVDPPGAPHSREGGRDPLSGEFSCANCLWSLKGLCQSLNQIKMAIRLRVALVIHTRHNLHHNVTWAHAESITDRFVVDALPSLVPRVQFVDCHDEFFLITCLRVLPVQHHSGANAQARTLPQAHWQDVRRVLRPGLLQDCLEGDSTWLPCGGVILCPSLTWSLQSYALSRTCLGMRCTR